MADLPDPSTLTDEELDAILEGTPPTEDEPEELETPTEEPEEESEDEPDKASEVEAETEVEPQKEPEKPSRREQLRIQQLIAKMKDQPKTQTRTEPEDVLDYDKTLEAEPELIARLKEDRERSNQHAWNQGMEQAKSLRFHTRLEIDAPRVEEKYPQLDKESDKFHPGLANAINTMYLSATGYDTEKDTVQNPDIRYGAYVESIFELANEIATSMTEEKTKVIKKQAAQTGLRPDGSGAKKLNLNKAPQDMTDEELDATLKAAGLA